MFKYSFNYYYLFSNIGFSYGNRNTETRISNTPSWRCEGGHKVSNGDVKHHWSDFSVSGSETKRSQMHSEDEDDVIKWDWNIRAWITSKC